ncbi:glycosyltransferase family 32 protein [Isoalcanivorax beigongshangi]|uniref:Glycosyltransferase family 32 protein n=1 Tax=Isoalcanivorax beigongshangi TaxID=3238810 RepID=A0ABV4ADN3_9GAMM
MHIERIPRIAHYIWIGPSPKPQLVEQCIASFQKWLPDFELICWDNERSEEVFRLHPYAREAYEAGLYAFASDVIRLHALVKYGGVYLDSDLELFKPLEPYLEHRFFSGFQDPQHAITAIMGSEKNGEFVCALLAEYQSLHLLNEKGEVDFTTNTYRINQALLAAGIVLEDRDQILPNGIAIYRREIFCPYHPKHGGKPTDLSVSMHHFNGSWVASRHAQKLMQKRARRTRRMLWVSGLLASAAVALVLLR